jgi:tetratricopeptide (TPR) repeat protein
MTPHSTRLFVRVLLIACCLCAACRRDPAALAGAFVDSGDRYAHAGKYREAILEYRNALQHQSTAAIHAKLAAAYDGAGERENALAALAKVTVLDETNDSANLRVSQALVALGRFDHARELAERVLRRQPSHVDALTIVAMAMAASGEGKAAQRKLDEAFAVDPQSRTAHLARASFEVRDRRLTEARQTLRRAAELHPGAADVWLARGSLEWQMGARQDAERSLRRALDLSPDKRDLHRILGSFFISTGRAADAEPHFQAVAHETPSDRLRLAEYYAGVRRFEDAERELGVLVERKSVGAVARLRRAQIRYSQGRREDADADLAVAMQHPEVEPEARLLKSRVLLADGNADGAIAEARRVVDANPRHADASYAVAVAAVQKMDWAQAAEWFERTRMLSPTPSVIDVQLARVALAARRPDDAVRHASRAARDLPGPDTHALLARALRAAGDLDGASRTLEGSRRRWPGAPSVDVEAGYLALQRDQPRAALAAFERAVRGAPDHPGLATLVGMIKQENGDGRSAAGEYERALARNPRNGVAANNLAWLYAQSGRLAEALTLAEQANEALGGAPQTLDTLGWVRHLAGRSEEAIHDLRAALEKEPDNPTYHYHLAAAYQKAGRPGEARESVERALRISSTFREADAARKMLQTLPSAQAASR